MLTIRLDSPVSINDQIVQGIRRLIAGGELKPGDELPTVRQLAADLGVNLNTVARAYRELEDAGLVSTVRGRGTQLTAATLSSQKPQQVREQVSGQLAAALTDAKLAGWERHKAEAMLQSLLDMFWPKRTAPE